MKNNLKLYRGEAQLTLSGLGDLCGITKGHIHGLEKGINCPTIKTAYLLANALGKSVYDIWPDTTEIIEETVTIRRCVIK
jgi:DNA-binding XRE family transcriptional regulator